MGMRIRPTFLIVLFISLFAHGPAAGSIHGLLEYGYIASESTTKNKLTGETRDDEFIRTSQLYKLDIDHFVYPKLHVSGGASLKLDNSTTTSDGTDFDQEKSVLRPYIELELISPLYTLGADYRRTEDMDSSGLAPTTWTYTDRYHGYLNWRPADLPRIRFDYYNSNFYDDPRTTDVVNETFSANARYQYEHLDVVYSYSRSELEDREVDFTSLNQTDTTNISYSRTLFDSKVTVGGGYKYSHSTTDFSGQGSGFLSQPRSGGLFSLDDDLGLALQPNNELINNIVNVSAGIDIGLDGDETRRTSIGIDFGLPVTIDTIFLWVDRSLSSTVANSFVWEVYTSPDNTDSSVWTLHSIVSPAPFGQVKNRFEIPIPPIETRFIKVVTRPLITGPSVPDAIDYPNIFITEIEGLSTVSGVERPSTSSYDHNVNFMASWNITQRTNLGYSFYYRFATSEPQGSETTNSSNTLSLRHIFNRIFTGTAHVTRNDSKRGETHSIHDSYGTSLSATWLETFRQSLTFSGTNIEEDGETGYTNTVALQNTAELYRDWSAYVSAGYSWGKSIGEDAQTRSTFTTVATRLSPNRRVVLSGSYNASWNVSADERTRLRQTGEGHIFVIPFNTLSFSYDYNFFKREDEPEREFHGFTATWSPFRGGTLLLSASYRQTVSTEGADTVSYGPQVTWRIARWAVLDVRYSQSERDSDIEKTDTNSLLAKLNIFYSH
jgi:hypothetical protein